jgi:acetyltransferase-like isoleucine patch superfamily enzyme
MYSTFSTRVAAKIDRLIQTKLWGMDIHPSVEISRSALIDRTWPRGIHIAAGCRIGDEAVVLTHDMTRGLYLDTRIGAGSVLGPRAIILPGITIGENCIVMPGALVTKDMPSYSVAVGNPATVSPRCAVAAV